MMVLVLTQKLAMLGPRIYVQHLAPCKNDDGAVRKSAHAGLIRNYHNPLHGSSGLPKTCNRVVIPSMARGNNI